MQLKMIYYETLLADVFLPCPDNLLVNLKECRELINDLLQQLPKRFANEHDNKSALGAALQAAFKLMVSLDEQPQSSKILFQTYLRVQLEVALQCFKLVCLTLDPVRCSLGKCFL